MILITGHKGFIGKNLTKRLANNKIKYQIYAKNKNYFKKNKIKFIFHLAFRKKNVSVQKFLSDNLNFTKYIIKIAKFHNAVIIFPSTIAYYPSTKPHKENSEMFSYNLYTFTKLLSEKAIINKCQKFLILRISNVYGCHGKSFIDYIKTIKDNKKKTQLHENDWVVRDFVNIEDLTNLFVNIITSKIPKGIYNVGSGTSIKLSKIISLAGLKKKINFSNTAKFTPYRPIVKLNTEKLNKFIRFNSNKKKIIKYINE